MQPQLRIKANHTRSTSFLELFRDEEMQQLQYPCDRKIPSNILDQTNIDLVERESRKGFVKECVKSVIFIGDKK